MIRLVVVALATLAGLKIAAQAYLYRDATNDIIVSTFQPRAVEACAANGLSGPLRVPRAAWSNPREVELEIGRRDLNVAIWNISHRLWETRYKAPYLVLTADAETAHIYCTYDIRRNVAAVHQF